MENLIGKRLGSYQLVSQLGKGGMGVVYKAYDTKLARYVALKVLPPRYALDTVFVSRFWQEAKAAANLEHPHIIPIYNYGEYDGYHYIAMRLVRAGSLARLLHGQTLELEQIYHILNQVGSALDYAHSREIIHRDVKPDNILISRRSGCLLTDFGIAKLLESTAHLTQTGSSLGTPTYMSPEQFRGQEDIDGRSDIYSLGVVAYEMATGRPPFTGNTIQAIQLKHLNEAPPSPRKLNPSLPRAAEEILLKALAKERDKRYASASEMAQALQAVLPASRASADEGGTAILGSELGPATLTGGETASVEPVSQQELSGILEATSGLRGGREAGRSSQNQHDSGEVESLRSVDTEPLMVAQSQVSLANLRKVRPLVWAAALVVLAVVAVGAVMLGGKERGTNGPPTVTAVAIEASGSQTATLASLASPHPSVQATNTPKLASTPSVTSESVPQADVPTATRQPSPSATPTPTATSTATTRPSPSATATPTSTASPRPSATATATPRPSATATVTPLPSPTATSQVVPATPSLAGLLAIPLMYGNEPKVYVVSSQGEVQAIIGSARQPDYSRDGSKLVINGDWGTWDKLRVLGPRGEDAFEIGDPALNGHSDPSWSPDASQVIYEDGTVDTAGWRIFTRKLSDTGPGSGTGTILKAGLGRGELLGRNPLWTTRDRIIFRGCNTWEAGKQSDCGIWVMQGNGGTPRQLTASPNHIPTDVYGDTVVYVSAEAGDWNVYTLDLVSGSTRQLTQDDANDGLPTISPDGRSVAFLSDLGNQWAIWYVPIRGGTAHKLFDLLPEWGQPRPDAWSEEKLSWGAP
jgi:serine/threonine protein kinase